MGPIIFRNIGRPCYNRWLDDLHRLHRTRLDEKNTNHNILEDQSPARQHNAPASFHPIEMILECNTDRCRHVVVRQSVGSFCRLGRGDSPEQQMVLAQLLHRILQNSAQVDQEHEELQIEKKGSRHQPPNSEVRTACNAHMWLGDPDGGLATRWRLLGSGTILRELL